jgi:autotransporter-like protein
MLDSCRPLVCAAGLIATLCAAAAQAQTVIVRHAAAGSTVELVFNTATAGTATVAAGENATIASEVVAKSATGETSAHVFVDACPNQTRVLLVEAGVQPPLQAPGCDRRQVAGLYGVTKATTFVIDVAHPEPVMWLRQGPAPPSWLVDYAEGVSPGPSMDAAPIHFVLFAGGAIARFTDATSTACGTLDTCTGDDTGIGYRAGAAFWIKPYLAVEASYVKPKRLTATGTGTGFHFDSTRKTELGTLAGVFGIPIGRGRIFGQAGGNYHHATLTTNETIDAFGSQTQVLETAGWGWLFGGGAEVWLNHLLGLYAEFNLAKLKGSAVKGGQGAMDDHALFIVVGARVHVGR